MKNGHKTKDSEQEFYSENTIDLGPDCDAAVGDEAVLFGRQGQAEITLTELAALAGTINYELACAISPRVPRVYVE